MTMNIFLLLSIVILFLTVAFLGFLLLGALRALGLLSWRLEQLEATTPKRLGRDGLEPGKKAPDFTLPCVNANGFNEAARRLPSSRAAPGQENGKEVSLHDFAGRKVLLVFTQSGCGPCRTVIPELNRFVGARLKRAPHGEQVLVVNNGDLETTRKWGAEVGARFPVLAQDKFSISKKYEVFATPFAFLINEKGIIASKGIINNRQHIRYVLSGVRPSEPGAFPSEPGALATGDSDESNGDADSEESEPSTPSPLGGEPVVTGRVRREGEGESAESISISLLTKEFDHV